VKRVRDQLGRNVDIPFSPQRIVSLVPSQTELLFDLGLDVQICGVTKFCIHPREKIQSKEKIGGTKNLNLEKISDLHPDLIIANKEENEERQVRELMERYPVWISDVKNLDDAYAMIKILGEAVEKRNEALEMVSRIRSAMNKWKSFSLQDGRNSLNNDRKTCAYLIWYKPYMTVGSDTFIHHMLEVTGFKNVFAGEKRYPHISIEELRERSPEFVLLSSEPYPFKGKHIEEIKCELPDSKALLVDGEMFSWYGSRLLKVPEYFKFLTTQY